MSKRERLDVLLVTRELVQSRELAKRLIMAGEVLVGGQLVDKPGTKVPLDAEVTLKAMPPYVSRGGEKLAGALDAFPINVEGRVCADVGASTGGFTDCLLQHGAAKVYAIDVGYGQLDYRLQQDERVIVMDRTNARYVERLSAPVDLVTIDASFISLRLLLPVVRQWLVAGAAVIPLIKPQFEAGKADVGKGGVVRDPAVHRRVLVEVLEAALEVGFDVRGLIRSPLKGPSGNIEFVAWLALSDETGPGSADLAGLIAAALEGSSDA
ncbi:MAG: TlyA family RNA methyltransferase [Anaerolineae bacterium]|nr:TlyA family RNA methyltransferase [Anaerolineae bacterium]